MPSHSACHPIAGSPPGHRRVVRTDAAAREAALLRRLQNSVSAGGGDLSPGPGGPGGHPEARERAPGARHGAGPGHLADRVGFALSRRLGRGHARLEAPADRRRGWDGPGRGRGGRGPHSPRGGSRGLVLSSRPFLQRLLHDRRQYRLQRRRHARRQIRRDPRFRGRLEGLSADGRICRMGHPDQEIRQRLQPARFVDRERGHARTHH